MLRNIFCFILFLFICGCFSPRASQPETTAGKATDLYSWDFGQIQEGVVVRHDFIFKNDSQKTLKIKDVTTSCGCTATVVKKNVLLPLESTVIEVRFNSMGYSGDIQQFIYVHTDNIDKGIFRFIIKANVIK